MNTRHSLTFLRASMLAIASGCLAEVDGEDDVAADAISQELSSGYDSCGSTEICFYTGRDGTGDVCRWNEHDQDWQGGSTVCSWSKDRNVCSVINNTRGRIEYFKQANYSNRVGSTAHGQRGNLACTYKLRSHRFQ